MLYVLNGTWSLWCLMDDVKRHIERYLLDPPFWAKFFNISLSENDKLKIIWALYNTTTWTVVKNSYPMSHKHLIDLSIVQNVATPVLYDVNFKYISDFDSLEKGEKYERVEWSIEKWSTFVINKIYKTEKISRWGEKKEHYYIAISINWCKEVELCLDDFKSLFRKSFWDFDWFSVGVSLDLDKCKIINI